jgi:hypothetical protein
MTNPVRQTLRYADLDAGDFPVVLEAAVISSGHVLKRGSVLGQITASKEYVLSVADAEDGSQHPSAILDQDVDTTEGALSAPIRLTGQVLGSGLTLGEGHNLADAKATLRVFSIFIC